MLKITFDKEEPKLLIYRDYKTLSLETFSSELFLKLESKDYNEYQTFEKKFVDTLKNQAQKKSLKFFEVTRNPILIRF